MPITITHQGRPYTVEAKPEPESPYVITNSRGKEFALIRNKPKPWVLFAVGLGHGFSCPRNMWFTDQDGTLKSCTP